ncbi:hypothetical protein [Polaromonas naphthalenivorans]|uniref:DUF2357 domain-containing protein n=1 Tax=Polaromonas naphthalenivorans (strain CJ2) TaxID=365044 RepID=A1VV66_POLNA|nr:hypothetical protein [Polaromonas naphthalenivorans]ABM39544.1 hypothetical protein Pnap_4261 [Polaromonas naphthalenivorans CJ2]
MKVFDRYVGADVELPAEVDPGRYRLLAPVCLNGTLLLQAGEVLWSDGGSRCLLTESLSDEQVRSFRTSPAEQDGQTPGSVIDAAVLAVAEQVESMNPGDSLPSPVMPTKLGELAQMYPLERLLETTLSAGHLQTIAKRPRMDMRYDTEMLPVSRVQRMAVDAVTRLASHSEDWIRREITGVVPGRLKAEISQDELVIYENIVFARLLDRLRKTLRKRLRDLDALLSKQAEAGKLENAQHFDHRLRHDLCELWGRSFADQPGAGKSVHVTRDQISALLGKVTQLQRSTVVQAIPPMQQVPLSLRSTNILQHDPHYRHLRPLWLLAHSTLLQQARSPQDWLNDQRQRAQRYSAYTGLLVRHALHASKMVDPQGEGASWRFGPSTLTLRSERGDWILQLRTGTGSVEQLTVVPAWRGCRDWEGQKLDRCVLFCHPDETEADDSATGSDSVLNPLQFYGVERVRQAIERWLLAQLLIRYPFHVKNVPAALANDCKNAAPNFIKVDGRSLSIIGAPDAQVRAKLEEFMRAGKTSQETTHAITNALDQAKLLAKCRLCGQSVAPSDFKKSAHGFKASCGCGHTWTFQRSGDGTLQAAYRLGAQQRPFSEIGSRELLIGPASFAQLPPQSTQKKQWVS